MTSDHTNIGQPRINALAALVNFDAPASRAGHGLMHSDGTLCSPAETALIDSATSQERHLAQALHGGYEQTSDPQAGALSELLTLAGGTPRASVFAIGLCQAFLLPDDSHAAPACEERTIAFADLYRRLELPCLEGADKERAAAILDGML
jgi:hypothetical protein